MRPLKILLLLPFTLTLTGCPGNFQQQKMQADIDGLHHELDKLKADSTKNDSTTQLRQRMADLGAQLDQLRTDLSLVQGRVESLQNDVSKRGDDQLKTRQDLEIRIAQIDDQLHALQQKIATVQTASVGVGATNPPQPTQTTLAIAVATPAVSATPPPTPTPKDTDVSLYQRGVEAFDAKRFGDARVTFQELCTKFPKSAEGAHAHYWIGEAYYAEKDFASAALEFEKVIKDYPNSDKVPAAMLREGSAFIELGEKDGGVETLKELTHKFPKSNEAKMAKEKLSKLK